MLAVLQNKQVKIRKPHRCYGCLKIFEVGTLMNYLVTVDGGEFHSSYMCSHCEEASLNFTDEDWECLFPGDIGYWKEEKYFPRNQHFEN